MSDLEGGNLWPEEGLERVVCCPVCAAETRKLLHGGLRDRIFSCAPGDWKLYRCQRCGSGYLDPRPTPQTIGLAYTRYLTHTKHERRSDGELNIFGRLRRAMANGYRNARFGIRRQPQLRVGTWVARLVPGQRAMIEAEGRHLPRPDRGATLLDVGCGEGRFLEFALEMGWKGEGVEPDPQAAAIARKRGCVVHEGSIESLSDRKEAFDVITLSHVIEHVHHPRDLLAACFRLLKPGGLIWLETPNLEAAGHLRYGRDWRGLEPPRHLVLFTWASLRSVLHEVGFATATPLPARPTARDTFPASEAIRKGEDPNLCVNESFRVRWKAWRADLRPSLTRREFITIAARKPSECDKAWSSSGRPLLATVPIFSKMFAADRREKVDSASTFRGGGGHSISVALCTYNGASFLGEQLDSISTGTSAI